MTLLDLAARTVHLAALLGLVGSPTLLLLAEHPQHATARSWDRRLVRWMRALAAIALVSGLVVLGLATTSAAGVPISTLDPGAVRRYLLATAAGRLWLVRHALLVLLAAFLALPASIARRADWQAARGESALLALAALVLGAASGHAATVVPSDLAVTSDALHLAAAGVWLGGLAPLALLLRVAGREAGADARPYAVVAARRFSGLAALAVAVLLVSGAVNTAHQVASVPALLGTRYGHRLLVKLALIVPVLGLAALNRRRFLPLLGGPAALGRPAMRSLARSVLAEAALALAILAAVALLGATPPARHETITWPLPFRFTMVALDDSAARVRAIVGSQVALLGIAALLSALVLRSRRRLLAATAGVLLLAGSAIALPPLAVAAAPTTYRRPARPYSVGSIAAGAGIYNARGLRCHGADGTTDGARSLGRANRTDGDLFWAITAGVPGVGTHAFAASLDERARWDLVNALRAFADTDAAGRLGSSVDPARFVRAPDFAFAQGPTPPRALSDYRQQIVLLVLYSLPGSRARMARLAEGYALLQAMGAEIIAVPRDADPQAIRHLGGDPPVLFPVVTEGASEILRVYGRFAQGPHEELLIDRHGDLRARWLVRPGEARDLGLLVAELQELNQERRRARDDEHLH